ncbi:hypothetical protein LCGC14_1988630, partial [marine sediment metagenome]
MPHPIASAFVEAAHLVAEDPRRQGNTLRFDGEDEIIEFKKRVGVKGST